MIINLIWLTVALTLILFGANILVDGAATLARRMGMSDLLVGLTVVALGTSSPELAISVISSVQGASALAVGNVVGSNICNILIIIGVTALIRPIRVGRGIMIDQMPMMVVTAFLLLMLGNTHVLDGGPNIISRTNGIFLLLLFIIFMLYTILTATREPNAADSAASQSMPIWRSIVYIIGGLAALVWGGDRFVDSASELARLWGLSEAVIGLTIVAIGTSLPELATSIVAAIKGNSAMAVGNVIGSNIFNATFILGTSAVVRPLSFGSIGNIDLGVLVIASLLFWFMAKIWGHQIINRYEGALLVLAYVGYVAVMLS